MKNAWFILLYFGLVNIMLTGCKKSDTLETSMGFLKVKMYDDSLADPRNQLIRIAAGNDRLFMTYGYGADYFFLLNGQAVFPRNQSIQWMIANNEGNLIKRDSISSDYKMGGLMALDDNSFLIAVFSYQPFMGSTNDVKLYHFDQNGNIISIMPLVIPISLTGISIKNIQLSRSLNGNPLIHILFNTQNSTLSSFIGEMNLNGNFLWYRAPAKYSFSDFIPTTDGGYMLFGITNNSLVTKDMVFIMKLNAFGDSLWSKQFVGSASGSVSRQIIQTNNGGYRFSFYDFTWNVDPKVVFIYEISSSGDSLNAVIINETNESWPVTLLPSNGDGSFAMLNKSAILYDGSVRQNTSYVYMDNGLKITQRGKFHKETTDFISAACKTSDGNIACFGVIQSYNQSYYKPLLIISK